MPARCMIIPTVIVVAFMRMAIVAVPSQRGAQNIGGKLILRKTAGRQGEQPQPQCQSDTMQAREAHSLKPCR